MWNVGVFHVLNVAPTETMPKGSPSRGALPLQYLVANDTQTPKKLIEDLLNGEEGEKRKYAGFTTLAADCLKNKKLNLSLEQIHIVRKKVHVNYGIYQMIMVYLA